MAIRAVHVRHLRSVGVAALAPCSGLNVLIGKNNAGKSNLLTAIGQALGHLRAGKIAVPWDLSRPQAEFNGRDTSRPIRIGIEFDLSTDINVELRSRLTKEAPHLERSIEQIGAHNSVAFILAGAVENSSAYLFLEQMAVGKLTPKGEDLSIDGIKLLSVTKAVARELYRNTVSTQVLTKDLQSIEEFIAGRGIGLGFPTEYLFEQTKERRVALIRSQARIRSEVNRQIETLAAQANSFEDLQQSLRQLAAETKEKIESYEKRETEGAISAFAGETRVPPAYAGWMMQQFGSAPTLYFRETKRPIGREDAETLLRLKVRRGGPERLRTFQQTVKALLGVSLDAFESEARGEQSAELDVDDFLVEANGAGIREALRVILDLELKSPQLALIEEPEVHLHPGLARVLASYLREKSQDTQMFITTHSTDFVDFVPLNSVFLISRDDKLRTICEQVDADEAPLKITAELGLKLSTVFMYDSLLFVEGPSDEAVLRELARKLDMDLTRINVGFVYMQGARNFAHFAAEATLDLLSRRKISLCFVVDRDERDDGDVLRMMARLGERSKLLVLVRREIENYLLDPETIRLFIDEKLRLSGSDRARPEVNEVEAAIRSEAVSLKDEVIRLRLENRLLRPVFLHTRATKGSVADRIAAALSELAKRQNGVEAERTTIANELDARWEADALILAPGSLVLHQVAQRFGVTFSKEKGDSERLARHLPANAIPAELRNLLTGIGHG